MEFFRKHADAMAVIGAIVGAMIWMNGKFNAVDNQFHQLEKDLAIIKTVLVMKNIMPVELASHQLEEK